jgi:hypothetical protein
MGRHYFSFSAVACALLFNHEVARASVMIFKRTTPQVDNITEGGQVVLACSSNVQTFSTEVFVDLKVNLTTLTLDEIDYLEGIFMTSYNQLSYQVCDRFFRTVEQVTLNLGQSINIFPYWHLQQSIAHANSTPAAAAPSSIGPTVFTVTGQCRNCLQDDFETLGLFDNIRWRRLHIVEHSRLRVKHSLQGSIPPSDIAACKCPTEAAAVGLTADEFAIVFKAEIELATSAGNLTSVQATVTRVQEGQQVNCSNDVQTFQTSFLVDFNMDAKNLTADEIRALEDSIRGTYNGKPR